MGVNKIRNRHEASSGATEEHRKGDAGDAKKNLDADESQVEAVLAMMDKTDKEIPQFRYVY